MKTSLRKSIFLLCILFVMPCKLLIGQNALYTDTIPYSIVRDKIIVTLQIDGKPANFMLDTGGRNLIVYDSLLTFKSISLSGETEAVSDFNGVASSLPKAKASEIVIGKSTLRNVPFIVMANNNSFRSLGISGLISGEALQDFSVKINSREKLLTLSYPFRPKGISRKEGLPITIDKNSRPIIPIQVGNSTLSALFDTGADGLLLLSHTDCEKLKETGDLSIKAEGKGIIAIGQGGMKNAIPADISRYQTNKLIIKEKEFIAAGGLTKPSPESIIGAGLLEYGDVLIDYPRYLFYFFPFSSEPVNLETQSSVWDIRVLPVDSHFEVSAVIGNKEVKIGEKVHEIAGNSLKNFKPDEVLINALFNSIKQDSTEIRVGEDEKNTRIVIVKRI